MTLIAGTQDAVNLCVNGGMDEATPSGRVPAAWLIDGASANPATFPLLVEDESGTCVPAVPATEGTITNFFARLSENVDPPGYRHKLQFVIRSGEVVLTHPCNLAKVNTRVMARDGDISAFIYDLPFTVEFSVRVTSGEGTIELFRDDLSGETSASAAQTLTKGEWKRLNFQFMFDGSLTDALCSWLLKLNRTSTTEQFEIELTAFQWISGSHTFAPFSGDPSYQVTPRNAILLVMGNTCPPGTRPLDEARDNLERRIPIGAGSGAGDLEGEESHLHDTEPAPVGGGALFQRGGGEEGMKIEPPHVHFTTTAPNRPFSHAFTYCIKL